MEEQDVSGVDWNTYSGTGDLIDGSPLQGLETDQKLMGAPRDAGGSTEEPDEDPDLALPELQTRGPSRAPPRLIPAPDSPNLSIQLPSSPPLPAQLPPPVSSFGRKCTPSQAPVTDGGQYDHLSYRLLHEQ